MAVSIRLNRQGAKKNPTYLIVAVDTSSKRDGEYLAKIGYYYPKAEKLEDKIKVDSKLLTTWLSRGARCTETVGQLLKTVTK